MYFDIFAAPYRFAVMIYRIVHIYLVLIIFPIALASQFNVKIGYNGRYIDGQVTNAILNRYRLTNPNFEDPFSSVHVLHGLEAGVRYKFGEHTGIEFTWVNAQSGRISSFGQSSVGEPFINEKWTISNTEFMLGLETYPLNNFGFGVAGGSSRLKTLRTLPNVNRRREVTNELAPVLRFHLVLQIKTRSMGFAIKPFYTLPLSKFDLYNMDRELNPSLSADPNNFKENLKSFGISMVFYNGPQS